MDLLRILALFLTIISLTIAISPSSTFIDGGGADGTNVTISINVPSDRTQDDLFFHVSAPAGQSWVAFGFGTQMAKSLILVAYTSKDGNNVTISPRIATGHSQPEYDPSVTTVLEPGSGIINGTYVINGRCNNCTTWATGSVDVTSSSQPMIYAVGSAEDDVASDELDATIEQHYAYGQFTMNLKQATGDGGVPTDTSSETGVKHLEDDLSDNHTISSAIHGLIMAGTFVILFPVGALFLRVLGKVWLHWLTQTGAVFCVLIGAILGIYISVKHDNHPRLNTPHQGIGLAIFFVLLIQLTLGVLHHVQFRKTQLPTPMGKVHKYLGPAVILAGIANGALGFNLAGHNMLIITYFVVIVFVAIGLVSLNMLRLRRQRQKVATTSTVAQDYPAAYEQQYGGDIPLATHAAPPAYGIPTGEYPQVDAAPPRYL